MAEFVTLETTDGIGTIRFNRPPVNALNDQVTEELAAAARAAAADEVRAVIIYGGEKVFAGGADITVMAEAGYAEMAARGTGSRPPSTCWPPWASRWSPRSPATRSAAAWRSRWPPTSASRGSGPGSASRRSCSASSPGRAAPSGCPA